MEQNFSDVTETATGFDFKKFLQKLVRHYPWFIISTGIFLMAAYWYLHNKEPMHEVSTYILLHPEQLQKSGNDHLSINDNELVMTNENLKELVNNEVFILKSRSIIHQVVDSLDLQTLLYKDKKKISTDDVPFLLRMNRQNKGAASPLYTLEINEHNYNFRNRQGTYTGYYSRPLIVGKDSVFVALKTGVDLGTGTNYQFQIEGINATVAKYVSRVNVSAIPKAGAGMVAVSVEDEFYNRAKQIIEVLIYQFNLSNLEYKNQAERVTLNFLNKRIEALEGELKAQESQVSNYKAQNKIYDVSEAANQLLNSLGSLDVQKSQNDLKENLLELVEKNIKSYNGVEEIVPTTSGLQDEVLSDLINQYNKLVLNKRMIVDQGAENDPRLSAVKGQLEQIRANILKNVANIRRELTANKYSLSTQERSYSKRFASLPRKEKDYIEMSRSLGIKESLYVYLLQKREESNLRLVSSDMAQSRIIDEGVYNGVVSPNKRNTYLMAIALGLLLPGFIIFLRSLFSNKIESRDEIETGLPFPISGEIGLAPKRNKIMIVSSGAKTPVAEQLRSLRANLFHQEDVAAGKVFLVTSFMRGEGKSFISQNFADTLAVAGKKVVLLDFDLRKAILSHRLDHQYYVGLSNFLAKEAEVDQIIYQLVESKNNISFIPSGDNEQIPGELILSERLSDLFDGLRSRFDYIIVDTPPVGAVSDAITISKHADVTLYIVRHNYSHRSSLKLVRELHDSRKLPNISLVINGIKKGSGYAYGGYGFGYNYEAYDKGNHSKFRLN